MGAVAVESSWELNAVSRLRSSAPLRTVMMAVEISQPNKSKSTTVSMGKYTFVGTSLAHQEGERFSLRSDGGAS